MISEYKILQIVSKTLSLAVKWGVVKKRTDFSLNSISYDYDLDAMSIDVVYLPFGKEATPENWKKYEFFIPKNFEDETILTLSGYCFGCLMSDDT